MLQRVRCRDVIDSELRLLAAVRRTAIKESGVAPSPELIDQLLDERFAVRSAAAPGGVGVDELVERQAGDVAPLR